MRLIWRYLKMAERCRDMEFILYRREGDALVEGVANFKYMGRKLDQTDYDWPVVRRNVKRAQRVWGMLGKLLRREGADPKVAEMFYRAVTHPVLLFGSETWLISAVMERTVEGNNTKFLRQITGKRSQRKSDRD